MKFSVIIPAYNAEKTIVNTLYSIWNTAYNDYECIIIDDGSKDDTLALCRDFIKDKPNFNIYTQNNSGVSSARNMGISIAKGDWILFVDADDTIDKTYFYHLSKICDDKHDLIIFGYTFGKKSYTVSSSINKCLSKDEFLMAISKYKNILKVVCSKAYKRNIIIKHQINFNKDIQLGEDYLFFLKYVLHAERPAIIDKSLYVYSIPSEKNLSKKHYPIPISFKKTKLTQQALSLVFHGKALSKLYKSEAKCLIYDVYLSDTLGPKAERISVVNLVRELGTGCPIIPAYIEDSIYKLLFFAKIIKRWILK